MTRLFYTLLFAFISLGAIIGQSDSYRPADLVAAAKSSTSKIKLNLFTINLDKSSTVPEDVIHYDLMDVNYSTLQEFIHTESSDLVEIAIPSSSQSTAVLELVEVDINESGAYVKTMPSEETVKTTSGRHFRGIVKGQENSLVSVSIFDNEIMGFISETGKGNKVIGKLADSDTHIIYQDNDLKDILGFACETAESDFEYSEEELQESGNMRALSDCVRIYLEVDYDIYQDKGSNITSVTNFITGLFNQVATMYANEQINVVLSPLTIWTQPSPYNSSSSSGMLNAFLANTGAFDGDLAQLLSYKASGGIAYVNGLCSSNPDYSKSFSSINSTYQNVPTYSWSVMVMTHEFGHLFGSQHTHACTWNGNNTAIDGCYTTEGSCADPGIPSGGGTVMSYCHLTSAGINLNLGFGPQPGNLIRNRVTNASCTQPCDGDGGGDDGGGTDTCTDTEASLTIILDNYPGETTWTLTNSVGATLYSGGPYSGQGITVNETFCLVDGCYDFQINDSYGDGICCAYGIGSYDISIAGSSVASGGQFNSVEVTNFCVGGGNPPANCNDGIQNGNETGIDCGGPDCEPCSSCDDNIQNGNETGIDCGGPDCEPCISCDDDIQNGNETGVDCGGPDCPACPTCNDGVQNGNETGIDCGGPDCEPCDTGGGDDEIFAHYFESGWDGWQDGGSDCYRYYGSRSWEGNRSIRIRDNSGTNSAMTSQSYDLSSYNGVEVNFYFYPNSMESGEDFWLRYYDGSSWTTVAAFASGTSFNNNSFYVATVPILSSQYTMANNAQFRFQCDASSNADRIYIDAVTVTGLSGTSLPSGEIKIRQLNSLAEVEEISFVEEMQVSPNPATNEIRIKLNLDHDQVINLEVIDLLGRTVIKETTSVTEGISTIPLNIDLINMGTYFIKVTDADGDQSVEKFIKIR